MPFIAPTLEELKARARAEVSIRLQVGPLLDQDIRAIFSDTVAGMANLLHGHLDYLGQQIIPDTAEAEFLERWANIFGLVRISAVPAVGSVSFSGNDGAIIPAASVLRRSDGVEYSTDVAGTISGGTILVPVTATTNGAATDAPAATNLTMTSPVSGVNQVAVVDGAGLDGGADRETDAALRVRLLEVLQQPPMGGSAADYVAWAKLVPEITRAFTAAALFGLGTVGVAIMTDDADTGPLPTVGKVAEVQAKIDELKPVTADVTVFAPVAVNLDPTIQLIPDGADIRVSVESALRELVRLEGGPGLTISRSRILEAISTAKGAIASVVTLPASDVTVTAFQIHQLGTITWV